MLGINAEELDYNLEKRLAAKNVEIKERGHKELDGLVKAVLADGVFDEKEEQLVHNKAKALGIDADEFIIKLKNRLSAEIKEKGHKELDELISAALEDGKLDEKEKQVLSNKAKKLGIEGDELEMLLENRLSAKIKEIGQKELESLTVAALEDGKLDEKERELIRAKAQEIGYNVDEYEIVLAKRLHEKEIELEKIRKEQEKKLIQLIDSVNINLPLLPEKRVEIGTPEKSEDIATVDNKWLKQITTKRKVELSKRFDNFINYSQNANQSSVFPGSILQVAPLREGSVQSIGDNFARKPITLTMPHGGGSIEVKNPSFATINEAMNKLVAEKRPTPAFADFQMTKVHSEEQTLMDLGLNIKAKVKLPLWSADGELGYEKKTNNKTEKTTIMLYFKEICYTMSIGNDLHATDIFSPDVDIDKLKTKTCKDNPLCVINEMDYGRIILVKVTSTDTEEKMMENINAAINAKKSFKVAKVDVSAGYKIDKTKLNKSYEYQAQIIGGKASDAAKVVDVINGFDAVLDIIKEGADYTAGNPAFPIAFRTTYLKDATPVITDGSTQYGIVEQNEYEMQCELYFHIDSIKLDRFDKDYTSIYTPKLKVEFYEKVGNNENKIGGIYIPRKTGTFNIGYSLNFDEGTEMQISAKKGIELLIKIDLEAQVDAWFGFSTKDVQLALNTYIISIDRIKNIILNDEGVVTEAKWELDGYDKEYWRATLNWSAEVKLKEI